MRRMFGCTARFHRRISPTLIESFDKHLQEVKQRHEVLLDSTTPSGEYLKCVVVPFPFDEEINKYKRGISFDMSMTNNPDGSFFLSYDEYLRVEWTSKPLYRSSFMKHWVDGVLVEDLKRWSN